MLLEAEGVAAGLPKFNVCGLKEKGVLLILLPLLLLLLLLTGKCTAPKRG